MYNYHYSIIIITIIIIFMPPPLLKHSSHPLCGSAGVWCEATYVVTGVIAATVVVVTTVVASCPAGGDRTAAMQTGRTAPPGKQRGDGDLAERLQEQRVGDGGKLERMVGIRRWMA